MKKYVFIIIPLITLIIAQIIKCLIELIKTKKLNVIRLLDQSGGMPSSHCSLVSSLTMTIYQIYGPASVSFGICLIFSLIVIYDAMGIRYETGKQAEIINKIVKKVDVKNKIKLKEMIGHKPLEVLCGIILGVLVSFIYVRIVF